MGKEKFEDICVQNLSAEHFGKYVSGKLKVFSTARCCTEFTESPDFLFEKNNEYYGVEHLFLDLSKIFQYSNCSLLQQSTEEIPEESYAEQISKTNGDKPVSTYVPFRNGLFLSSAASIALSKECGVIYYGAHADDSAGFAYPDCSPVFNQAMNEAIWEGSGHQLKIEAPFVNVSKAEVVRIGLELGVPYELTWSCYEGGEKPCGKCGTCIDRAAAFQANHVEDPALR